MQVAFKLFQRGVKRSVAEACSLRWFVVRTESADLFECGASRIVLQLHHMYRIADGSERRSGFWAAIADSVLQGSNVGKENVLFFHHVRSQLGRHALKSLVDLGQFWMSLPVNRYHFGQQLVKARKLLLHICMVSGNNVFNQVA